MEVLIHVVLSHELSGLWLQIFCCTIMIFMVLLMISSSYAQAQLQEAYMVLHVL